MKILLTGFQRSGTSMHMRIFSGHPQVRCVFNETGILTRSEDVIDSLLKKKSVTREDIWFEKLPFNRSYIKKRIDPKGKERTNVHINDYYQKWFETFGNEARIIFVARHPIDVVMSNQALSKRKNKNRVAQVDKLLMKYAVSVTAALNYLKNMNNVLFIKYEDTLINPEQNIKKLFRFCGLSVDLKNTTINKKADGIYIGRRKIRKDRAFAYRYRNDIIKVPIEIEHTIDLIDFVVHGTNYNMKKGVNSIEDTCGWIP